MLQVSQRYWSEDGYSFGVGDEEGYVYSACCRAATDEESAALRAEEERGRQRQTARERLTALAKHVRTDGDYPKDATLDPDGRWILSTRTIYGGGDAWYVAPGSIWYLLGNGGDGDDWSRNNHGSEIAWRLADPDGALATELEAIAQVLTPTTEGTGA